MLDIDKIRQLVDMMVSNDLVELSLRDGDLEVNLRRPSPHVVECAPVATVPVVAATAAVGPGNEPAAAALPQTPESEPEAQMVEVKSPMVGTFYTAPDPESPPFVQPGAHVHPDTVVCVLEAMKVFNEIKAEVEGVIDRVLAKNGEAVEFGQPMFRVRIA